MDSKKLIYLTIDDFPSQASRDQMKFLKYHQIQAVYFCVGNALEQEIDLGIEALRNGFILANHSYHHKPYSSLSLDDCLMDIRKCDMILQQVYDIAGLEWKQKYFRFPYGDRSDGNRGRIFRKNWLGFLHARKSSAVQEHLAKLRYSSCDLPGITYAYHSRHIRNALDWHWTLDALEWCLKTPQGMFGYTTVDQLKNRLLASSPFDCRGRVPEKEYGLPYQDSNEILLMHDHDNSIERFTQLIQTILRHGYEFARFS